MEPNPTDRPAFRDIGNKRRLVDRVVTELEMMIVEGTLRPGDKLPPERELTDQLGVSRTALREALQVLMTKGLLGAAPGVGTIVRQVSGDQVVGILSLLVQTSMGGMTLDHLHQVRSILEVEIAGIAATEAKARDVEELRKTVDEMTSARGDPASFADADSKFHLALAETTHNPLIVVLLASMQQVLSKVRLMVAARPDLYERVMPQHTKILQCVTSKDKEGARLAMREHLEQARVMQAEESSRPKAIGSERRG